MTKVRFGVSGYNYPPADIYALTETLEELGFSSIWWGEHYITPAAMSTKHPIVGSHDRVVDGSTLLYDLFCTLSAIAGSNKTLEVNTAINIVPLNHPLLLARSCATLHDLSGGRFRLGMGAGWLAEEFAALGIPFAQRGSRLDEAVEILRKAFKGGFFDHHGKIFNFESLQITPHPTPVPLIGGGNKPKALRRAAATADGWLNSVTVSLEECLQVRDAIETARVELGTADGKFEYFIRPSALDARSIESFVNAGFTNLIVYVQFPYPELDGPIWPNTPGISMSEKRARLKSIAQRLGVGSY
jgi:probable F420-dependent oxidoreductase